MSNTEMQARFGAVARRRHHSDLLSARHTIALLQRGLKRFVARHQVAGVRDRQDRAIHHAPGEVHDSRVGRDDDVSR
ncbi:hypothetical protein TZ00_11840 [Agreia bicolorata]|uniref:Uncharacterized protein n=1 Tax=Agreia bicolorata TaxID=110935 RepID=A0ABR5CDN0_9MICO|nr:hypothetical protein [Agreia bicolorata]KJC63750.1 hypothetical protein TZ00_11840 [Agreia bicolorata]